MASSLQASSNGVSMDQQAQLNGIVQQDAAKGRVAVHTFNPDATPQEKAAAAGKSRDQVKSNTNRDDSAGGKGEPQSFFHLVAQRVHNSPFVIGEACFTFGTPHNTYSLPPQ